MGIANGIRADPKLDEYVTSESRQYQQEPIAVVGMACRLPGHCNSPRDLWDFLERGGIADFVPPESRFRIDTHHDGSKKPKTMRSPGGMFIEDWDLKRFDAAFFGIGKTDAIAMDPQQRQLLEVVYECLENAGISLQQIDGQAIGCFVGSYSVDYADMQARDPDDRPSSVTIGVGRAILSNRISHFLNIYGPSLTIDTACSGSLVGLDVACRYLSSGEINGALVCGANLYLNPEHNMDSGSMKGASSLSGRCHTFDKKADGYIKAEAINCVMLKRLADAERDGDPIRAIIRGTATNSDGRTPGIASPSAEAQSMATRAAYRNAGIHDLTATGYIEMHGTGTQAGDPQEVKGVASVFASSRTNEKPLIIGSIKSNIGHSEPAAGISGLMKAILAVENGRIPGNPTFIDPNPNIDFAGSKVKATNFTIPWPSQSGLRRASVNSFGYGGSNAHVIIDEVEEERRNFVSSIGSGSDDLLADEKDYKTPRVLPFSASDDASLKRYLGLLRKHLLDPRISIELPDLAYTLSERRTHHFHRGFIVTKGLTLDPTAVVFGKLKPEVPRIGFVFTGQGAQWSQMGSSLVQNFPEAHATITRLDKVLQGLAHPPKWTLFEELTKPNSPEKLRQPEFSQPLVTALQIAILQVFKQWSIEATAVVGHSSGEIAAAYAAGLITEENAIIAAFYRGYAATVTQAVDDVAVGMLAVGLGPSEVSPYIAAAIAQASGNPNAVSIACYNSPSSVTLSGEVVALEAVRDLIQADSHFARMLQVDMAYHSPFMTKIGTQYANYLQTGGFAAIDNGTSRIKMFSSVHGGYLGCQTNINYWKSNMERPVLFDQALKDMLSSKDPPTFLIEIGPSGALAGPIAQIKKELPGGGTDVQYCTSMKRGREAENAIFETVGRLFLSGYEVDFKAVNGLSGNEKVLIDLPNYSWNHSTEYWYESEASADWRQRRFPHHDLLGSKVLGTPWQAPAWKKSLNIDDLPWLKDHRLGPEIVFPGAGYMCMAVEAMMQTDAMLRLQTSEVLTSPQQVRLRNVFFDRALVLEEGKEVRIMFTLAPFAGVKGPWYQWVVRSLLENTWVDHCRGQVRMEKDVDIVATPAELAALQHPTSGISWYKSMSDAGYNFGKLFQGLKYAETTSGSRKCRSHVHLDPPASTYTQSEYPLHPAAFDSCMQSCAPGLWAGIKSNVNAVLVPATIDDIIVRLHPRAAGYGISSSVSMFAGPGRAELTKNYSSNAKVFDPETRKLYFKLTGLRYHMLDFQDSPYSKHRYSQLLWQPDVMLSPAAFACSLSNGSEATQHIANLFSHKWPNAKIVEASLIDQETQSVWLDGISSQSNTRNAFSEYNFLSKDASAVISAQEKYEIIARTNYRLFDISASLDVEIDAKLKDADLAIVSLRASDLRQLPQILRNVAELLKEDGHITVLVQKEPLGLNGSKISPSKPWVNRFEEPSPHILEEHGFKVVHKLDLGHNDPIAHGLVATLIASRPKVGTLKVDVVHFSEPGPHSRAVLALLSSSRWQVAEILTSYGLDQVRNDAVVLVLSELDNAQLPSLSAQQWTRLQGLFQIRNRVLWVSKGSQWQVTNPNGALIHGLCRSIRTEDPSVRITTLDIEDPTKLASIESVSTMIREIQRTSSNKGVEAEYVERGGIFHVSRILGDDKVNAEEDAKNTGHPAEARRLHESETTIRLIAERVGSIDSLHYVEIASHELPLPTNTVEVELFASALNFKDVAVTMGIVPENHHLLGLEGAGIIRRVGNDLRSPFHVGQRVLVFEKGTFANRIIATTERTIAIPEWLGYKEAATLPSVYLTALYSLYNLSGLKGGDRVLIHSATGGLGIASIQLCRAIGAEVFATVGQDFKKEYLMEKFGIPASHIFSSRTSEFEARLMEVTDGYGVDIILNSLTGDLLDASWRCIAEGGTMVELGKKDHIDRNTLAMEPFARNASYRCFDMSHKHVTDTVIAGLMEQMMSMVGSGDILPIEPLKLFSYDDIPSALRFMRSASHIGKIIISNELLDEQDPVVNVRPAPRSLRLRDDVSYLIVGGLKGLCGSLAVDLARHGARNVVVIGRSGYSDERSLAVLKDLAAEGCHADLICGDVSKLEDVRRAFASASKPVGGVIQGAMVLRDKPFESMTLDDYHTAIASKVAGTWNLHNAALEAKLTLDFFTTLSSISGLIGQPAQANYAAANVFLDNFAYYRRGLGLAANSVNLGAIEDVGYMAEHSDLITALDTSAWTPINEPLFHKIVQFSILQQDASAPINPASANQLITSIAVPQAPGSRLLGDARFSSLVFGTFDGSKASDAASAGNKELQALLLLMSGPAPIADVLPAAVDVVNKQFTLMLRLDEPLEPGKPLSAYGLDSLAGVEFRNWARAHLGAELTTLEITGAPSLLSLVEKMVTKIRAASTPSNGA